MELKQLEQFLAVADCGSFTGAAARLYVVQSTVSTTVRSLETDLGVRLFNRTHRSVRLTEQGRALLPEARRVLATAELARDAVSAVRGEVRGTLRLGIMHALPGVDLAGLLAPFHEEHSLVRIEPHTHPRGSAGLVAEVAAGRLDLAIAAVRAGTNADVEVTELVHEPMRLARPPRDERDPGLGQQALPIGDLVGTPFIDVPPGWGSRDSVDTLFARHGLTREVVIEVADVATVLQLVRAGLGSALVAPSSAPEQERATLLPVDPAPLFTVSLVTPTHDARSAAARIFADRVTGGALHHSA